MSEGEHPVVGDRYELLERIGAGGQAEVWLAADRRLNGKRVAVKRLLGFRAGGNADPMDLERARREAFAASRLDHPNLVAVTDFVAEGGEPFIVMEYVAGPTLEQAVAAGGMPVPEAARLIGQIAGALAEAHESGIVHRDIKPANILIDARGTAKLADFGIARVTGDSRFTQTGTFTGTVAYLAPELLDGSDPRPVSDIWSLGATLFELVEGRKAFAGPTVPALLNAIVQGPLPAPSRGRDLENLLSRMIDRDPTQRPTAAEVAALLAAAPYLETEPDTARGFGPDDSTRVGQRTGPVAAAPLPNPPTQPVRSRRRGRVLATVGAVVVVAAAATGIALFAGGDDAGNDKSGASAGNGAAAAPAPPARADGLGQPGTGGRGTYSVGVHSSLTGPAAVFGKPIANAVRLAAERIDGFGGDLRIKVVPVDDANTNTGTMRAAQRLVGDRTVVGVVGPISSPMTIGSGAIYSAADLALVSPAATATPMTQLGFTTFHQSTASDKYVAGEAGTYLARAGAKSIVVVDDATVYGRDAAEAVVRATPGATTRRVTLVPSADPAPAVSAVDGIGADAVFYGGNYSAAAKLARALTAAGFRGLRMGIEAAGRSNFVASAGDAAKGWYFAEAAADPGETAVAAFAAAYEKRFGSKPNRFAAEAFDAANSVIEAIRAASKRGTVTRAAVEREVDDSRYQGLISKVDYNTTGVSLTPVAWLWQVRDGVVRGVGKIADLP